MELSDYPQRIIKLKLNKYWLISTLSLDMACCVRLVFLFCPPHLLNMITVRLPNIFEKETTPVSYSSGSVIFSEGQKRDRMYVVRAGEVALLVRGQLAETVSVDGFFGELAMIDDSPRTATAVAQNRLYTNPHQRETICVS